MPDLLRQDDVFSKKLKKAYAGSLYGVLKKRRPDQPSSRKSPGDFRELLRYKTVVEGLLSQDVTEAERMAGKGLAERLRFESFLGTLREARTILIDLPDYSKTDMRSVSTDLEAIYWIWNELARSPSKPNIVISFQKELFRGHFFLGKMNKIELKPFKPETLVGFYEKQFNGTTPFTRDGLLLLARMSRGIFRRFLRYITLTHHEQAKTPLPITADQVHESIPPQLLAQDMDQQLIEIFPKQPDLRIEAVKLLLHLEEHGPTGQAKIAELLNLRDYAVSRLLNKLEDSARGWAITGGLVMGARRTETVVAASSIFTKLIFIIFPQKATSC
jgi:hypothetical protein